MNKDSSWVPPILRKESRYLNHESPDGGESASVDQTVDKVFY